MSDVPMKQCTGQCGQEYPATSEHFHHKKSGKYGLQNLCKQCKKEGRTPVKPAPVPEGFKRCTGSCGKVLPLDCFYKADNSSGRLSGNCKECANQKKKQYYANNKEKADVQQKRYRESHKEEITEYHRQYRLNHKEKRTVYHKRYYQDNKAQMHEYCKKRYNDNKEKILAQQKQYYIRHKEKIAAQVKQYTASHRKEAYERTKRYSQTAKGQLAARASKANRRARKKNTQGSYTAQELQEQLARQKHKCYYCKAKLGKKRSSYHADHIVPLSRGGTNYIDNIVLTCSTCNLRKHNKLLHEWLDAGRLL
jgi:5-methylcytosine-specific restriction endonuclease McrA